MRGHSGILKTHTSFSIQTNLKSSVLQWKETAMRVCHSLPQQTLLAELCVFHWWKTVAFEQYSWIVKSFFPSRPDSYYCY